MRRAPGLLLLVVIFVGTASLDAPEWMRLPQGVLRAMPNWLRAVVPLASITYVASPTGNHAAGTACTDAAPCSTMRAILTATCSNHDVIELLDGVYSGLNYIIDLYYQAPGKSGTDDTHRCTVRARNEVGVAGYTGPGVVIDGQWNDDREALQTLNNSWWTFQGFDIIRSGGYVEGGAGIQVRRVVASNIQPVPIPAAFTGKNTHVWNVIGTQSQSVFEDLAGFGAGRNMLITAFNGAGSTAVYRRIWLRHQGYPGRVDGTTPSCDVGPSAQAGYHGFEPYNQTYENIISVHSMENLLPGHGCYCPTTPCFTGATVLATVVGHTVSGLVAYGYDNAPFALNYAGIGVLLSFCPSVDAGPYVYKDLFFDVRSQRVPAFYTSNIAAGCLTMDRLTGLRVVGNTPTNSATGSNASSFATHPLTNWHDCTDVASCPDFYTGVGPAGILGARNCYEYLNGVLQDGTGGAGTSKLWPWKMDDRIKAALQRERDAGRTGAALAGGAGSGYAAGTVTSEIVSRYGPVPAACNRTGSVFVPDFPVVTDFPSTAVLDSFDRPNGGIGTNWTYLAGAVPGFNIVSNQITTSASTRALWNVDALPPQQEAHATWTTVPADGTESVLLMAANTSLDDSTGWHVILQRVASGNDRLKVARIPGGYTEILNVDLGGKVADGNLFGVRIAPTQTVSVYWRYSGVTYRVGSVIDTNLPLTSNQRIGVGGVANVVINDFGGTSSGGVAPSPGNIGRFGSLFPKQ